RRRRRRRLLLSEDRNSYNAADRSHRRRLNDAAYRKAEEESKEMFGKQLNVLSGFGGHVLALRARHNRIEDLGRIASGTDDEHHNEEHAGDDAANETGKSARRRAVAGGDVGGRIIDVYIRGKRASEHYPQATAVGQIQNRNERKDEGKQPHHDAAYQRR